MHRKIVSELMDYEKIIMPKLKTRNFIEDGSHYSNRIRYMAAHCKFHDYAKMKLGDRLIDKDERYTTQTCCKCFERTQIGKTKIFKCSHCYFKSDRDVNSSVNILVKNHL
jgi:putative transposase